MRDVTREKEKKRGSTEVVATGRARPVLPGPVTFKKKAPKSLGGRMLCNRETSKTGNLLAPAKGAARQGGKESGCRKRPCKTA